jgi:malate/lactate dehydrogenase
MPECGPTQVHGWSSLFSLSIDSIRLLTHLCFESVGQGSCAGHMAISIAIIGASGAVGTTLAAHILRSHLLDSFDRLQLVGHGSTSGEARLLGTRIDLLDAFDDERVEVEMVPNLCDVDADIVVVAAGVSISSQCANRRDMGSMNRKIFELVAEECSRRVPEALFIVVSNPVELAVDILCSKLDRNRVFGMGSQQDSLRFARAIARDLGVSRRDVRASVVGEHGLGMVPLWSTLELHHKDAQLHQLLDEIRDNSAAVPLNMRVNTFTLSALYLYFIDRKREKEFSFQFIPSSAAKNETANLCLAFWSVQRRIAVRLCLAASDTQLVYIRQKNAIPEQEMR